MDRRIIIGSPNISRGKGILALSLMEAGTCDAGTHLGKGGFILPGRGGAYICAVFEWDIGLMDASDDLFANAAKEQIAATAPLAVRMRPESLDELLGQEAALGAGTWLASAISSDSLSSLILFGPAGSGKTSLAHIIANTTSAAFVEVSAVSGSVADLRREIQSAHERLVFDGRRTILFVDEIHRFSRSQQDALLHAVEDRTVVLVGATTENPYFEVNSALLSRSRVIEFKPIPIPAIRRLLLRALGSQRGLASRYAITGQALDDIASSSGGDARAALTTLELSSRLAQDSLGQDDALAEGSPPGPPYIDSRAVREASGGRGLAYDKHGEAHYDIVSAFIKSMRGSDPDAAVYWLARMIAGGEDPKFIARRIMILASEDIGNADPQALLVAHAAFKAAEAIGYPECRINLSQAAIYMALAPKSNAAEAAIDSALADVQGGKMREVPPYLRDRHRPGSGDYGDYLYPHDFAGGWVRQRYLPQGLEAGAFYHGSGRGWEAYRSESVLRDRETGGLGGESPEAGGLGG